MALLACSCPRKGPAAPTPKGAPMSLLPVRNIWETAAFDEKIREKVALELVVSWPIAAHRDGHLGYWFFYYAMFGPPPAPQQKIWPPSWRVWIDGTTGAISDLRRTTAREAGLQDIPDGTPFTAHVWPKNWTVDEVDHKRVHLLAAYDRVIATWNRKTAASGVNLPEVEQFKVAFQEITPPLLLPCYRTLGADFFRWLGL